jgi:hypothetical protein
MFEQFVEHDRRPKETAKCLQIAEQSTVTNRRPGEFDLYL